jgi:ABC-type lipoprotein release transport system permease subunit
MTPTRLLFRSLLYHGRANLAVALGAAVGSAVLAGALLVGDSLRGSLRDRADRQLAGTGLALVGGRFFREELAAELPGEVRPVLLLSGSVQAGDHRAGRVTVIGADSRFGLNNLTPTGRSTVVSDTLARSLNVTVGGSIEVNVQKASAIPRSSALARRDTASATRTLTLTVSHVLPPDHPMGEFTLAPGPAAPLNLIVPLDTLQQEIEQPGRVNTLLSGPQPLEPLQDALAKQVTLDDWGLKVHIPPKRKAYVSVESRRLLLEPAVVSAAVAAGDELGYHVAPTFVYLANGIAANGAEIPYSVVAAVDPNDRSPLNPVPMPFADDEIVLVGWDESPLKVKPGDTVTLTYFKPEVEGKVEEAQRTFRLKAVIPLEGAAADPGLVPEFPGISDRLTMRNWDPPFPYDNTKIRAGDANERFWQRHRTTPKAYVTRAAAQRLWKSRFGDTTSVRLAPKDGDAAAALPKVREALLRHLEPARGGFAFDPVRERALEAGRGSTDFGLLFLGFSFFLIVSALMLVGLLFRLNLERRAREVGLLRAAGYPLSSVRRLLLVEGLIVSVVGSAVGLVAAAAYASGMLAILARLWPTPGVGSFLTLHVSPWSLVVGFVGAVVISLVAIWWAVRGLSRIEPSHLLKGVSGDEGAPARRPRFAPWIAVAAALAAVGLIIYAPSLPSGEPRAGAFFGGGALLLIAALAGVWTWLRWPRRSSVRGLTPLGMRNVIRNPTRSLLTAGLLASAAFLLVAVESFRRQPDRDFRMVNGGSGGFEFVGESDVPIHIDLSGDAFIAEVQDQIQKRAQREGWPDTQRLMRTEMAFRLLQAGTVYPFRVRAGEDASCLNLYQATRPRVLGVPDKLVERGGFRFGATLAATDAERENPWLLLNADGDPVPAFVEENTAVWQLKKGLGDEIEVPDEEGRPVRLRIVGFLKDSVFQSELLVGDAAFRRVFPRTEGFSYFLFDVSRGQTTRSVQQAYEEHLAAYGFTTTRTIDRVAGYLAVENTYLSTFQLLGGFGLLLGVLGLAIVLLRNVWERRSELALLRAVGYRSLTLNRLVFTENALLLVVGLGVGVLTALAAVAPHVLGEGSIPWERLALMLGTVLAVGLVAAGAAVAASVRTPVVTALRQE